MAISNAEGDSAYKEGQRKRKRSGGVARRSPSKWKTDGEQKIYSSKLLEALRRVRRSTPATPILPRSRAVREAANRALAAAARGKTRWSRAILTSRTVRLKARRKRRPAGPPRPVKTAAAAGSPARRSPVIERKARVLGRLVPGCRKLSFPTLLDEASDYIAALEMQVRAMSALADILSSTSFGAPPTPSPADPPGSS